MSTVRSGKVEIILCSSLNRLAHSSLELVELLREFLSRKITLIIPNQHIDTSKMPRKVFLGVLDAIEEFKRATATETSVRVWPPRESEGEPWASADCECTPWRRRQIEGTGADWSSDREGAGHSEFDRLQTDQGCGGSLATQVPDPFA